MEPSLQTHDRAQVPTRANQQAQAKRAYIEQLTLLDDLFMSLVFEDKRCVELVLRLVLGIDDLQVQETSIKHSLANLVGRSAQIDVLATDSHGRRYDIEVQRDARGAIPRRVRYYGALLDSEYLQRGEQFSDLPETYVVFITEQDILGAGEQVYHVERSVRETGDPFDDGMHVLYVNCACPDDGTPLGDLAHDFRCADPAAMRYNVLRTKADSLKNGKEAIPMSESIDRFVEEFKDFWREEGEAQGMEKGETIGAQKANEATALNLLRQGTFSVADIASWTGLSLEQVSALATRV